ncbi:MAG: type VI secretion system tube protein Hcp [Nitrospira sp.]|nr:type VI secretion system tube protein Hcp [Nitrospira sp.]MDH4369234.1 type VI secretion system tube protein Hcp [Nitrospira sp.]MDH5496684.1 type VI secretion system tube protein Hcp [Nitrospira sp.]MDH5724254.1 type VI secretion system tube protein Hcp [Nitrospira sp.]
MAAVDYFLKIAGIEGESNALMHKGDIQLDSWSFGGTQTGGEHFAGHGGVGKFSAQDFNFTMKLSKASPKLFQACATGQHLKDATLVARKAGEGQQEYYRITFSDCLVSSYQQGGAAGSDLIPTDQASLSFGKIEIEYTEQRPDGSLGEVVKGGYDLKLNKSV